jgi:hypothetical protein
MRGFFLGTSYFPRIYSSCAVLCIVYSEYLKAIDVTRHARLLDRNAFLKKEANPIACRDPGRSVKAPTHVIKWPTGTQKSPTCVPTHPPHWRRESAVKHPPGRCQTLVATRHRRAKTSRRQFTLSDLAPNTKPLSRRIHKIIHLRVRTTTMV